MDNKQELAGVHGWLMFRILIYVFFVPMSAAYYAVHETGTVVALEVGFALYCIATGVLLYKLDPLGVKMAIGGESFSILIGLVLVVSGDVSGGRMAVGGLIWLLYFLRSKRVKNTYGPLRPQRQAAIGAQ